MFKYFLINFQAISFLLNNKKLWKHCVIPFLISLLVMAVILYFLFLGYDYLLAPSPTTEETGYFKRALNWVLVHINDGVFSVFKWIIFVVLALAVFWYTYSVFSAIIMLPFLEFLSSEVEAELRGKTLNNPWYTGLLGSILFSFSLTFFKIFFMIVGFVISFVFPPFAIINFFVIAWFCSAESIDYCMSRNLYSVWEKIKFLFQHKFRMVPLGSFSSLIMMIPILGVTQPILAAISGAIYFVSKTPELGINEKYAYLFTKDNSPISK